ncbi:sugar transport 14-like [Chlorella sorokiniana]|uniref:Sugar transport 14-like n=1 Tax=Chlorella sorokiniana TaxID=3076 RepID=A0A2P6U3U3_CHLSO|nr:sugar transport 14-like [Chlorella sorokiniana]|eukprot:PRW60969.1 sugar transport 14-like [Chlorella sorokiniana]
MGEAPASPPSRSKSGNKLFGKTQTHETISAGSLGYKYRLNWYLLYCVLWGGFVHITIGYDVGVAGGLFSKKSFLARFYPNFKGRNDSPYCSVCEGGGRKGRIVLPYTSNDLAIYSFMLYPSMMIGCFVCGWLMRRVGRPAGIQACGLFNIVGAIVQITANNHHILLLGRAICGFGEGFGMFVYNIYIAEIAPAQIRGKCVGSSVIWSATGVTLGQLTNFLVKQRTDGWQIAISMIIVPASLLIFSSLFMKDTPVSLLMRGKKEAARLSLQKYRGIEDVDAELRDIEVSTINRISTRESFKLALTKKQYYPALLINAAVYTLLNWTGNTAIVYYGPQIFSLLGMGSNVALWNATLVGGAKILGVFIGMYLLDRHMTRRTLLTWGGITQAAFLIATAIIFATEVPNVKGAQVSKGIAALILVMIILYEICFMGGQHVGTLGLAAEVCPIEIRPAVFPMTLLFYGSQSMAMSYRQVIKADLQQDS